MKKILIVCLISIIQTIAFAQGVAVNENGAPASSSAILDISSTTKGVLVPRMTNAQRITIAAPAEGLLVFDTDSDSFWFYSNGWHEIAQGGGGAPTGPASGDLSGNYPAPNVVKIQNLDVATGTPLDKQVLKWDSAANNWKGRNDSLFLPYNAMATNNAKLFGIQNNNTSGNSSAIYGRTGTTGSGITPGFTKGVWGDNSSNGVGVLGTSYEASGIFGSSIYHHGITGTCGNVGFAGVYGNHVDGGYGILGEVEYYGIAIGGKVSDTHGTAGLFESPLTGHDDTTFIVNTAGIGNLSLFNVSNTSNNNAAMQILHNGGGAGLKVRLNKPTSNANGVDIFHQGSGNALYSKSHNGIAGKFEIANTASAYPVLNVLNQGLGNTLTINSISSLNGNNVVDIQTLGTGNGLSIATLKARCAFLTQNDASATNDAFSVNTSGKGSIAKFTKNNTTGLPEDPHDPAVLIDNNSKGVGLKINSLHNPSIKSAIEVQYAGQASGIYVNSDRKGIFANSNSSIEAAIHAQNSSTGIAINATSQNSEGIKGTVLIENTGGGNGLRASATGGSTATGIRGFTDSTYGSGVYGYTSGGGGGVMGVSNDNGIGVKGDAGTSSNFGLLSRAGVFTTHNPENTLACLTATHYGNGIPLLLESKYAFSYQPSLKIQNNGYGNFVTFDNDGVEKFFIENDGDIYSDGSIYVMENKGIVRNTYSSQLRVETVEVTVDFPGNGTYELFVPNQIMNISVSFNTAFSSPPTVCLGNYLGGVNGDNLTPVINNVTNSGCTVTLKNLTSNNISVGDHGWKLMVMGVD